MVGEWTRLLNFDFLIRRHDKSNVDLLHLKEFLLFDDFVLKDS